MAVVNGIRKPVKPTNHQPEPAEKLRMVAVKAELRETQGKTVEN
ncbi:hypothetical protein [Atlantibacter sp.]|nr:hypothetical protein [Atlantibacter sp.]